MSDDGLIPRKYRKARLIDFKVEQPAAFAAVTKNLAKLNRQGVVVEGSNGVGKTHLACAVATHVYETGKVNRPPVYVQAAALPVLFTQEDTYRDQSWLHTITRCPLLVIDDLGKEDRVADWKRDTAVQRIGQVLRSRCQDERATFITTNLTQEEVEATYGPSIASILQEMTAVWLAMVGKDRRRV